MTGGVRKPKRRRLVRIQPEPKSEPKSEPELKEMACEFLSSKDCFAIML